MTIKVKVVRGVMFIYYRWILYLVLILFCGCKDSSNIIESEVSLFQTQWEGTLSFVENNKRKTCDVIVLFETLKTGEYISDNLPESSVYSDRTSIEYVQDGEILSIFGGVNNLLNGDWWIMTSTKEQIVCKREPHTKYESILILNKLW